MANKYKDEKGHWTNKENDGGPCHHDEGGAAKQDFLKRNNAAPNSPLAEGISKANEDRLKESFDDDYDEEFNEPDEARGPYDEVDFNKVKDVIDDQFGGPEGNPSKKQVEEVVFDRFNNINPEDEAKIKEMISEKFNKTNNIKYDKEDAEKFKNAGFDVASEEEVDEIFGNNGNKVKIGDREMTLDEWNNKMKNASDKEMAREFMLIHAPEFNMSENEMEEYLKNNFDDNQETYTSEENKPDDFSPYNKNGWKMSRDSAGRLVYGPDDDYFGKSGISFSDSINRSPEEFYKGLKDRFGEKFDQKTRDDEFYDKYYRRIDEHNGYRLYQNPETRRFFIVSPNGEEFGDYRYPDQKVNKAIWDDWKANGKYNPYYRKGK